MVRAMLNRPTAQAESQDLSRDLEVKVTRRAWNPALHPRDSKGRFIETGGTVRLWGGKLARVVRALPHDRILVQDQSGPDEFKGRRHTTSAKWVSMVARPDGSAPTDNEDKVAEEDEKRLKDSRRGNGVARDDDGDPDTRTTRTTRTTRAAPSAAMTATARTTMTTRTSPKTAPTRSTSMPCPTRGTPTAPATPTPRLSAATSRRSPSSPARARTWPLSCARWPSMMTCM